jgi:hypothetical protein
MYHRHYTETDKHIVQYCCDNLGMIDHMSNFILSEKPNWDALDDCRAMVEHAFVAMPVNEMAMQLRSMQLLMVSTLKTEKLVNERAKLYAMQLRNTPCDIFLSVIKSLSETDTFFPALNAFQERINLRLMKRTLLRNYLNRLKPLEMNT